MAIRTYQGMTPQLGERVFVDESAVVIGDVQLGADSSVWPLTVIRGDMHRIRIGARTSVQDGSVLHITHAGPFNPDGYPLIGPVCPGVFVAGGHGMWGMAHGPATGRLLAERIVTGVTPPALAVFDPLR